MANKIGMCCYCGDQHHSSKTIMTTRGLELCARCFEQSGADEEEDDTDDLPDTQEGLTYLQGMGTHNHGRALP